MTRRAAAAGLPATPGAAPAGEQVDREQAQRDPADHQQEVELGVAGGDRRRVGAARRGAPSRTRRAEPVVKPEGGGEPPSAAGLDQDREHEPACDQARPRPRERRGGPPTDRGRRSVRTRTGAECSAQAVGRTRATTAARARSRRVSPATRCPAGERRPVGRAGTCRAVGDSRRGVPRRVPEPTARPRAALMRPSSCQTPSSGSRGRQRRRRASPAGASIGAGDGAFAPGRRWTSPARRRRGPAPAPGPAVRGHAAQHRAVGHRLTAPSTRDQQAARGVDSASQLGSMQLVGRPVVTTASASSSGPVSSVEVARVPGVAESRRSAVTSRTLKPRLQRCTRDGGGGGDGVPRARRPAGAAVGDARLSMNSVARDCQGCSSRRTISSPVRAVLRQCTRRRSSPRRYSRTVTSSALPIANARGRLSPEPVQPPPSGIAGSGTIRGVTGSVRGAVERPLELDQAERVATAGPSSARVEPAADVGAHRVRRRCAAPPGPSGRRRTAVGCRARRGAGPRAAARRSGIRPSLVERRAATFAGWPAATLAGRRVRHQPEPVAAAAEERRGDQGQRRHQQRPPGVSVGWPSRNGADDRGDRRRPGRPVRGRSAPAQRRRSRGRPVSPRWHRDLRPCRPVEDLPRGRCGRSSEASTVGSRRWREHRRAPASCTSSGST